MIVTIWLAFLMACGITAVILIGIYVFLARTVFVPCDELAARLNDSSQCEQVLEDLADVLGTPVLYDPEYPDPDPKGTTVGAVVALGNVLRRVRELDLCLCREPHHIPWIE